MGFIPPTSISTSSPGQSANQNSQNGQTTDPLYDIAYAYQQQSAKNSNSQLRFSLSISGPNGSKFNFQAKIDPNHLIFSSEKRVVELNVLTGVVLQDFGFNAQRLELKGTTGSAYYRAIVEMQRIFDIQSAIGIPSAVAINVEGKSYTGTWREFVYDRQNTAAGGNTINYTMSFTIIQKNIISSLDGSLIVGPGGGIINLVSTNGLSVTAYLKSLPSITLPNLGTAQNYVVANWPSSSNGGAAFPGLNVPLLQSQVIAVPTDWNTVFNSDISNVVVDG